MDGGTEIERPITQKQATYVVMLMANMFGGEHGRKLMLRKYFGKQSTNDFTFEEAGLVIELLLNHNEPLKEFYDEHKDE